MPKLGRGAVNATPPGLDDPTTIIDVVVRDGELLLVEPPKLFEKFARRQHAGRGDAGIFTRAPDEPKITPVMRQKAPECMADESLVVAVDNSGVLDRSI